MVQRYEVGVIIFSTPQFHCDILIWYLDANKKYHKLFHNIFERLHPGKVVPKFEDIGVASEAGSGVDPLRTLNHGYFPQAARLAVKDSIIPINVALQRALLVTGERCLLPRCLECTTTCTPTHHRLKSTQTTPIKISIILLAEIGRLVGRYFQKIVNSRVRVCVCVFSHCLYPCEFFFQHRPLYGSPSIGRK